MAPPFRPPRAPVADLTLLAELARMTPEERLLQNDRMATTILELRHGFAAATAGNPDDAPRPPGRERR